MFHTDFLRGSSGAQLERRPARFPGPKLTIPPITLARSRNPTVRGAATELREAVAPHDFARDGYLDRVADDWRVVLVVTRDDAPFRVSDLLMPSVTVSGRWWVGVATTNVRIIWCIVANGWISSILVVDWRRVDSTNDFVDFVVHAEVAPERRGSW